MNCVLEVIVCSVEDALQAERGGATRLEIVRNLESGGLTPRLDLAGEILSKVRIPARVILREKDGYSIKESGELDRLCSQARQMAALPLDGLVLGFIGSGRVDLDSMSTILDCASGLPATFHHAFEEVESPSETISELKSLPQLDRILTWGGQGSWWERMRRLGEYRKQARPEIEILAGGGLDLEKIALIHEQTEVREFHIGRAARTPEDASGKVSELKVRAFSRLLGA